jgi:predicted permease
MFSVVSGVLLRPLPFRDAERLVGVSEVRRDATGDTRVSPPTYLRWRADARDIAIVAYSELELVLSGGEPVRLKGAGVSHDFFGFLGVSLARGRGFAEEEDRAGAAPVVILGHELWRSRFGADPAVVSDVVTLDGTAYTVVGIAPRAFDFPDGAQVWTPLQPQLGDALGISAAKFLRTLGRTVPGAAPERIREQLSALAAAVPDNEGWSARVVPLHASMTAEVRSALLVLMAAVTFVLLIACANVANLLLARGTARRQELAVRAALGASRGRIARELVSESLLISLAAGVLGVLASLWGLDMLLHLIPTQLPGINEPSIDGRVLFFALGASVLTGLFAGALPAASAAPCDVSRALNQHSRHATSGRGSGRLRSALVITEVAASVVLLVGAGLLLRSFAGVLRIDPGFRADRVTTFDLGLPAYRYARPGEWLAFAGALEERVRALPGVDVVALTQNLPISERNMMAPVEVAGAGRDVSRPPANAAAITPDYFRAMGMRLVRGRTFDGRDREGAALVAIVDETFALTFFPGEDPIGKQARTLFGREMKTIVGVVADVRQRGLLTDPEPVFYTPLAQGPRPFFTLVVRSALTTEMLVAGVRGIVRSIDADQPLGTIATMEDWIGRAVARPRFYAVLLATFASLALLLAVVGLYAVIAQAVAQRRREIAVRVALGARAEDVLGLVFREGMRLTAIGCAIGIAGALAANRLLSGLLYGVGPGDPSTFGAAVVVLLLAAATATSLPARKAARTDPIDALRR